MKEGDTEVRCNRVGVYMSLIYSQDVTAATGERKGGMAEVGKGAGEGDSRESGD